MVIASNVVRRKCQNKGASEVSGVLVVCPLCLGEVLADLAQTRGGKTRHPVQMEITLCELLREPNR